MSTPPPPPLRSEALPPGGRRRRRCQPPGPPPVFFALLILLLISPPPLTAAREDEDTSGGGGNKQPPSFFLQDATDGLCLAGTTFRRCTVDTLFYVSGNPGEYRIHVRPRDGAPDASDALVGDDDDGDEDDGGECLARKTCPSDASGSGEDSRESPELPLLPKEELVVAGCSHCGAKRWNILGDASTGYVLSEGTDDDDASSSGGGGGKVCLIRDVKANKAMTVDCNNEETPYTPLQLQFVSKADIDTMTSPAAMLIAAAGDGDKREVQRMIKDDKVDVNGRDWDQLTALNSAAQGGHLDVVKLLIKEGADVNAHDKDQVTALMEACIHKHPKIADYLLNHGANVDDVAQSGVSALWLASSEGSADIVKALLKRDADVNNLRVDGISPLLTAAAGGHEAVVKMLLEAGADPTRVDKDGLHALMNAAESGSVPTMKLIYSAMKDAVSAEGYVEAEADDADAGGDGEGGGSSKGGNSGGTNRISIDFVNQFSKTDYTALIVACANGHRDVVEFLLTQTDGSCDVDAIAVKNGVTALMYAAASGHVDIIRLLLDVGNADVDKKHTNEGSALLEACAAGGAEAIKVLIEKGADYMGIDKDGVSALMSASSQGHYDVVEMLLDRMKNDAKLPEKEFIAFLDRMSNSGGTSVMFSAATGSTNVTKLLIEKGADIMLHSQATPEYLESLAKQIEEGTNDEEMDPHVDGVTALHVAAQGGHIEDAKLLLEHGADVSAADEEDRTPLLLAVKGNFGELATLLISKGADPNTPYVDDEGVSHNLLMDAIIVENEEFASLLISSGADIYYVDETGVSTLLQASHRGLDKIVKLLLEKHVLGGEEGSAQANYVDYASKGGITPLIGAASEGHIDVLKLLLEGKADVNAKDEDGTTALMASSARGHTEAVVALLDAGASINEQNNDGHTALMFAYNGKTQVETLWERYTQFVAESGEEAAEESKVDGKDTGEVIKEALETHTKLVNTLMERGADQKLKDNEGHTAGDFDYHPDLDGEVMEKEAKKEKLRDESKNEL